MGSALSISAFWKACDHQFQCRLARRANHLEAIMNQNKAYRAVEPEDLAILLLPVGEIGAMALSASLVLVLVWLISGSI
jgi:hypothetical protein